MASEDAISLSAFSGWVDIEEATTDYIDVDGRIQIELGCGDVRDLMRKTGFSQHTLEGIRAGEPVRHTTLKRMQAAVGSNTFRRVAST